MLLAFSEREIINELVHSFFLRTGKNNDSLANYPHDICHIQFPCSKIDCIIHSISLYSISFFLLIFTRIMARLAGPAFWLYLFARNMFQVLKCLWQKGYPANPSRSLWLQGALTYIKSPGK